MREMQGNINVLETSETIVILRTSALDSSGMHTVFKWTLNNIEQPNVRTKAQLKQYLCKLTILKSCNSPKLCQNCVRAIYNSCNKFKEIMQCFPYALCFMGD